MFSICIPTTAISPICPSTGSRWTSAAGVACWTPDPEAATERPIWPAKARDNENDFLFEAVPLERLYTEHTFTALFVARDPIGATAESRADEVIDFPLPTFAA